MRFPHQGNAAGFAFVTDQRVIFEARERVTAVALAYVVFAGRPVEPSLGDFAVTARTPGGPSGGGGEFPTTMRVRDAEAFHDFFPTLLDAARAAGALPEVDTDWGGEEPRRRVSQEAETGAPLPTEVVDRALATFMGDDERIEFAAELVGAGPVTVLVTQRRLVVVESRLIWATPLERTKVVEAGRSALEVCLFAETVSDSLVLSGGLASADHGARRLKLRPNTHPDADPDAGARLKEHLGAVGAGLLEAWPAEE